MKLVATLLFAVLSGTAIAGEWPFHDYPAAIFHGKSTLPKAKTQLARQHVTIIRASVLRGPNFAGLYTVVDWGCGTSCGVYVIVDDHTGKIYEPPEISKGVELGIAGPQFRADSTLMVVASCPPPEV